MASFLPSGFNPDFSSFFLEQQPRAAFLSAAAPFGTSPQRRRGFRNQFESVFDQYLAMIGQEARGGNVPTLRFTDFTSGLDFNRLFREQPRFQRGENEDRFNPRTRFLFGF